MTPSEKVLLSAIRETTREICRVVTKMWGSGVLAGVDHTMGTVNVQDVETIQNLMKMWKKDIDELMAWLDWNTWVKCRPACNPEVFGRIVVESTRSDLLALGNLLPHDLASRFPSASSAALSPQSEICVTIAFAAGTVQDIRVSWTTSH